jgi:hypothetical protein
MDPRAPAFSRFVMIGPVQTTRPRSGEPCFCNGQGRGVVPNDPDIGLITRERRGPARCPRCGPRKKPELRGIPWVRDRQPRRGTDARDPAWGGRPVRDRGAIRERWRSGWAYVRSLPDRLTSTASVCRQLVVRCWKRSSRSSVPALPVSVASKLRVATAKVEHTRPSTSGHVFEYRPVGAPTSRL